jgi:GNAT superfamily N-acetyltransferase
MPPGQTVASLRQYTAAAQVSPSLRRQLVDCWVAVTNAGGAVGFPFPPVDEATVAPAADHLIAGLDPDLRRLLVAVRNDRLAGWVSIHREAAPVITHWGTISRLQTNPAFRGQGIASALMIRARHIARDEMHLEQLHLAVRGGIGLEAFYQRLGWAIAGRWPRALRFGPDDFRDEILMILTPL